MCGCSKNVRTAWITVLYFGTTVTDFLGRNTGRNYGAFVENTKVKILRGDYDPTVMKT